MSSESEPPQGLCLSHREKKDLEEGKGMPNTDIITSVQYMGGWGGEPIQAK